MEALCRNLVRNCGLVSERKILISEMKIAMIHCNLVQYYFELRNGTEIFYVPLTTFQEDCCLIDRESL